MRGLNFTLLASFSVFFMACTNSGSNASAVSKKSLATDSLSYSIELTSKELPCEPVKENPCLELSVSLLSINAGTDSESQRKINRVLFKQATELDNPNSMPPKNIHEFIAEWTEEYQQLQIDEADFDQQWYCHHSFEVYKNAPQLFGVTFHSNSYTGGNHPNVYLRHFNFSPQTGAVYKLHQLFTKEGFKAFLKIAEKQFRKQFELSATASLESNNFWFPSNTFRLPANFKINKHQLGLVYQVYEVAPYTTGAIELSFSIDDLSPLLHSDFLFLQSTP